MKRILSGVQPTGSLHLGNYLGAIKQFVALQDQSDTECLYCVVDLHAITAKHDPKTLRLNTRKIAAAYLAAGVDPKKSRIFVQSSVPFHTELNWYLQAATARVGWLDRMTQFREKAGGSQADLQQLIDDVQGWINPPALTASDRESFVSSVERLIDAVSEKRTHREKASVGLYTYPVLQAADILLYKATHVPVGEDQLQHINLAGDIANKFNSDFEKVFPYPQAILSPSKRIMSLKDGTRKMSKSDRNDNTRINLDDSNDDIARKIRKAVAQTDPLPFNENDLISPAVRNLVTIYAAFGDRTINDVLVEHGGSGFGQFKPALIDLIISHVEPIREEIARILADPYELDATLVQGGQYVENIAYETCRDVRAALGFWSPLDEYGIPHG